MEEDVGMANGHIGASLCINPLFPGGRGRRSCRECLPKGHLQCASMYFLRLVAIVGSLDLGVLEIHLQFFVHHPWIAKFIKPNPKIGFLKIWMEPLNTKIKTRQVSFNHEACFDF